jgi:hypothetical protein
MLLKWTAHGYSAERLGGDFHLVEETVEEREGEVEERGRVRNYLVG